MCFSLKDMFQTTNNMLQNFVKLWVFHFEVFFVGFLDSFFLMTFKGWILLTQKCMNGRSHFGHLYFPQWILQMYYCEILFKSPLSVCDVRWTLIQRGDQRIFSWWLNSHLFWTLEMSDWRWKNVALISFDLMVP